MEKIGIAVVGCGAIARSVHLPNVVKHPELELLWCCDINQEALSQAKVSFHPRNVTTSAVEVAADPDCQAVLLSTTHLVRLPLIELFAKAGKHIYVEKPMADSLEEMKQIMSIVEETGIKFTVGHNRRMAPAVQEALRILNKHRDHPQSPSWRWDREGKDRPVLAGEKSTMVLLRVNDDYWSWKKWAFGSGIMIGEMTHFADLACYFINSTPVRVTATGSNEANHVITIEYTDGSLATIFATAFGSFGYPKELIEIYHNGAAIIVDHMSEVRVAGVVDEPFRKVFSIPNDPYPQVVEEGIEGFYQRIAHAREDAVARNDNTLMVILPDKGHYDLLTDFIRCIKHGDKPICNAQAAAVSTAVILRARESARQGGTPVAISPDDY